MYVKRLFFLELILSVFWSGSAASFLLVSMTTPKMNFERLTRRHGIKVASKVSVEQCSLAVGNVVGHQNVVSASRMNKVIVLFLSSVEKALEVVQSGIVIDDLFVPVVPLSTPSKRITLSNVPPFIKDEELMRELSRFGKIVSPIKKVTAGCRSPLLSHLVSFRRQVHMVLKEDGDFDVVFKFKVDDYDYTVFATSDSLKCFGCGEVGHLVRACPNKVDKDASSAVEHANVPGVEGTSGGTMPPGPPAKSGDVTSETNNLNESMQPGNVLEDVEAPVIVHNVNDGGGLGETDGVASLNLPVQAEVTVVESVKSVTPVVNSKDANVAGVSAVTLDVPLADSSESNLNSSEVGVEQNEILEDSEPMDVSETLFKVPAVKRKLTNKNVSNKQSKTNKEHVGADDENGGYSTDSSLPDNYQPLVVLYSAQEIKNFLQATKFKRGVKIEEFFPNVDEFVRDAKYLMKASGENCFTDQEVYRLVKIVRNLKKERPIDYDSDV